MRFRPFLPAALLVLTSSIAACSTPAAEDADASNDAITSRDARILDFKFSAEVITDSGTEARKAIVSQLMYAQGILTTSRNGNGRVGGVELTNVTETVQGAKKRIKYTASLPVAFPKDLDAPTSYALPLPLDTTALDAFNTKYDGKCGNNEYGTENFWHDWNPKAENCTIADADVSRASAAVAPHAKETKNKYPEYDQIWEDDRLDVVAIFGIITSNTPDDDGYRELNSFLDSSKALLTGATVKENATSRSILKDTTLTGKVTVGGRQRTVNVDLILVQELQSVGADFDTRYDALSEKADMLMYNGHAGLGKNVNALARKGKVAKDKYQLVLLNGCQTFAYIDTTFNDRRIATNTASRDPQGTKYMDIVGNALPGYANNLASMSATLFGAVVKSDQPKHYNQLLESMPASHIVVVFGEDDNRFAP